MDDLFAPPTQQWRRLHPRYATLLRIGMAVSWTVVFAVPAVLAWFLLDWRWTLGIAAVWAAVLVWRLVRAEALWRSWGYAELADDLYVTHGILFRSLTAVPYGRMQVVEIESGPIERSLGLATVKLVTAAANTDATIPGLPPEEAARLRDRLTALGEGRNSGL